MPRRNFSERNAASLRRLTAGYMRAVESASVKAANAVMLDARNRIRKRVGEASGLTKARVKKRIFHRRATIENQVVKMVGYRKSVSLISALPSSVVSSWKSQWRAGVPWRYNLTGSSAPVIKHGRLSYPGAFVGRGPNGHEQVFKRTGVVKTVIRDGRPRRAEAIKRVTIDMGKIITELQPKIMGRVIRNNLADKFREILAREQE